MPSLDEQVQEHAQAITRLEGRMEGAELRITQHDTAIGKLNEAVTVIREAIAKVATKDDIIELSRTISQQHTQELRDAHNSVPARIMMIVSLVTLALGLAGFALAHFHG
jgi:uncharacterized coiled-coil protein SlyX